MSKGEVAEILKRIARRVGKDVAMSRDMDGKDCYCAEIIEAALEQVAYELEDEHWQEEHNAR